MRLKNTEAAIVAIGDELMSERIDTNGTAIAAMLDEAGINVTARLALPDDELILVEELARLKKKYDVIVCCGGLGPTQDDLTRQAIAKAVKQPLVLDRAIIAAMQRRFKKMNMNLPESNKQQALRPKGAVILKNNYGSAPGFLVALSKRYIAALPGPPSECLPMLSEQLLPLLLKYYKRRLNPLLTRRLMVSGVAESALQGIAGPIAGNHKELQLGFLIQEPGEVLIKLAVIGERTDKKVKLLNRVVKEIKKALGPAIVSDQGLSLSRVIGQLLTGKKETIAVAESCTGGMISQRLTAVPGSSAYFLEGLVTYSNQAKQRYLGVTEKQLKNHGAVSRVVAIQMAKGIKRKSNATWTVSVTGIAGPGGGSKEKPVGLVHVGLAGPNNFTHHIQLKLGRKRQVIQNWAATVALNSIRLAIEGKLSRS